MKKALFYRLFGAGKLPAKFAITAATEGVVLSDEGLHGSLTYRNFHRPGSYSGLRKVGMVASIVVTGQRLAAFNGENTIIDVPFTDERLRQIAFSVEADGACWRRLMLRFFMTTGRAASNIASKPNSRRLSSSRSVRESHLPPDLSRSMVA